MIGTICRECRSSNWQEQQKCRFLPLLVIGIPPKGTQAFSILPQPLLTLSSETEVPSGQECKMLKKSSGACKWMAVFYLLTGRDHPSMPPKWLQLNVLVSIQNAPSLVLMNIPAPINVEAIFHLPVRCWTEQKDICSDLQYAYSRYLLHTSFSLWHGSFSIEQMC